MEQYNSSIGCFGIEDGILYIYLGQFSNKPFSYFRDVENICVEISDNNYVRIKGTEIFRNYFSDFSGPIYITEENKNLLDEYENMKTDWCRGFLFFTKAQYIVSGTYKKKKTRKLSLVYGGKFFIDI